MPIHPTMNTNRTIADHPEIIQTSTSTLNNPPNNGNAEGSSVGNANVSVNTNTTQKMKRMTLNEAQKYEICTYMKEEEERSGRPTNKAVSIYIFSKYNIKVDESTVSRLKQQAEKRLSRDLANPSAKRHRPVAFPELERLLGEFVQANKRKVAISDSMLLNKGKELRDYLKIPESQMKFSDGWLNKFKIRHGLKLAPIPKPMKPILSQGTKRQGNGSTNGGSIPLERPRQPSSTATLENDADEAIQSTRLSNVPTSIDHSDTQQDVDMDIDGMDIDNSDDDTETTMEQVVRSHATRINKFGSSSNTSAIPLSDATGAVTQQPTSRLLASSNSRTKPSSSVAISTPQLDSVMPIPASSTMDTDGLNGLGMSGATVNPVHAVNGVAADTQDIIVRPTPPVTAARVSLSLRLEDPIAAAFQPEPTVDFDEASQCVNTLRIFMQQQNFDTDQLEHLRNIYLTLNSKRKQS